uniref:G protein gamma domain-containing protein n=1 Tax=Heterorhabditis bacteriophora TaxID=37862 RepID=A0A1I7WUT3_HETBA
MSGRDQAIQQAKKHVEQLRGERNMRRTPVSLSAADLISLI